MKLNRVKIPQTHKLKILPKYFKAVARGTKHFEIRKNDRDYNVGDQIELKEHDGEIYTGNVIKGEITFVTDFEQREGYIVFSFRKWAIVNSKSWLDR